MFNIYANYKNYINQHSEAIKAVTDTAEFTVELLDIFWEYKLIQKLPPVAKFVDTIEMGILLLKAIKKPVKVIHSGKKLMCAWQAKKLMSTREEFVTTASKVASIVKDTFKWIGVLQGLGLLPPNVYVIVGLGSVAPNIWLIMTACSIISSGVKAMKAWKSTEELRQKNLDKLQVNLNQLPANLQSSAKDECIRLRNQVQKEISDSGKEPRHEKAYEEWNKCFIKLNPLLIKIDSSKISLKEIYFTIADMENWLSTYGHLAQAEDDPILTLEKESLEFGLIYLLSYYMENTTDASEKKLCRDKMQSLMEWKENRIYRSNFQTLKQGIDLTASAFAIYLMLQADQNFAIFSRYTLFKKGVAVFGHVVKWRKPV